MAPQLLFSLARHIVCNGHPFHQFVALGNNYRRPPEVRPGRVCSLVMREKGGGERPGRVDIFALHNNNTKTRGFLL